MPNLIGHLDKRAQQELLDDLNYLNLGEMRAFCREHGIPTAIYIETESGERRRTKDTDRKSVVLGRVRSYLKTGRVPAATVFGAAVVELNGLPAKPRPTDRLYYGCYDKKNPEMLALLRRLTDGAFRNGAVARILAREFWTAGVAPTFAEFARAWTAASAKGLGIAEGEHPEAAFLTDRAKGEAGDDWKRKRARIAARAQKVLATIPPR
ncbi:MAG: hypothetical protein AAF682_18930 [Planctomycetota bacterium]